MSKAIAMLIPALVLALPIAALAQQRDRIAELNYCAALSEKYIRYVANSEFSNTYGRKPEVEGRVALAKCQEGDTATAIPILERKLTNAKVELPAR